jgi:Xaa-Pro aminopeptidase
MTSYFDGIHEACREKWERLDALLEAAGLAALVVGDLASVRYVTGYLPYLVLSPSHGQVAVHVVGRDRPVLWPIAYYARFARHAFPWLDVRDLASDPQRAALDVAETTAGLVARGARIGVAGLAPALERALRQRLDDPLTDAARLLADARAVKTPREIDLLVDAVRGAECGMRAALAALAPGASECEVAGEGELAMRRLGAESHAIVLRGANAARMQEVSTDDVFAAGDMALVDLGCYRRGYRAEFARSRRVGTPLSSQDRELLDLVTRALEEAAALLRPGVRVGDVARRAYEVIDAGGYGAHAHDYPVGHGIGVTGSEHPLVVPDSDEVLAEHMVMNLEPGIFLPQERIGIRTEDIWLVTAGAPQLLTTAVERVA